MKSTDGTNNNVTIRNSTLSGNLDDDFGLDVTANGNTIFLNNSLFSKNAGDGIDISSDGNIFAIFGVELNGNAQNGLKIGGDNNTIAIGSSIFSGNEGQGRGVQLSFRIAIVKLKNRN